MTSFENNLIIYGGFSWKKEPTRDFLYFLDLKTHQWTSTKVNNSGLQFSHFAFERTAPHEILIFGGETSSETG